MHRAHRYAGVLFVAIALAASGSVAAAATPQEAGVQVRVYDSHHHDYHDWNEHEDHAYRDYLRERHEVYVEYERQNHKHQQAYWNWRHSHPD